MHIDSPAALAWHIRLRHVCRTIQTAWPAMIFLLLTPSAPEARARAALLFSSSNIRKSFTEKSHVKNRDP